QEEAERAANSGLALLEHLEGGEAKQRRQSVAFRLLVAAARARKDDRAVAEVLARHAATTVEHGAADRHGLESAALFRAADLERRELEVLQSAAEALPESVEVARTLGVAATNAGALAMAASAFDRAARIADAQGLTETAIVMHARAGDLAIEAGERQLALEHD